MSPVARSPFGRALGALAGIGILLLAGCASTYPSGEPIDPRVVAMYAPVVDGPFRIPAVKVSRVDPQYLRQTVPTPAYIDEPPGTIVVDPRNKFLYLVQAGGQSLRYGIGVGRQGFSWSGVATIKDKQAWPKWFPPKEMQERDPYAAQFPDGMDGGPRNPLGARALYLYQGDKDTLYRLHGTSEQNSIGRAVSSGCIRLFQQDIIDLYNRVPLGTRVVVLSGAGTATPVAAYAPVADGRI